MSYYGTRTYWTKYYELCMVLSLGAANSYSAAKIVFHLLIPLTSFLPC